MLTVFFAQKNTWIYLHSKFNKISTFRIQTEV